MTAAVLVFLLALPVFIMTPRNQTIRQGKSVVFLCRAVGSGKVELKWFKNGLPLQPATRILLAGSNLVFTEVAYSDEGKYTCQASNEAGMIKADAHLRVINKNRIGEVFYSFMLSSLHLL